MSLILFLQVSREEQEEGEGGQDEDKREQPTLHISCLDNLPGFCSSAIEIHRPHEQFSLELLSTEEIVPLETADRGFVDYPE